MFNIKVKWSDGRVIADGGYSRLEADRIADCLWAAGADDVYITCECGECETCTDRASFGG